MLKKRRGRCVRGVAFLENFILVMATIAFVLAETEMANAGEMFKYT